MNEAKTRYVAVGLGVLAVAGAVGLLFALLAVGDRSDRMNQLTDDLEAVRTERDELTAEIEQLEEGSSVIESRWLAAVAVSGRYSPTDSRLLAVEAAARSSTPEATAALGSLLFADARSDPPTIEFDHDGPVWATGAASNSDIVATGSDDMTAKLWSTSGELLTTLPHSGQVKALDFSADSRLIATGTDDGVAIVWTVAGEEVASVGHTDRVNDVAISDDGALMASGSHDAAAFITSTETGEIQHELSHPDIVWSLALSDDGDRLATGGQDGLARVWDIETGDQIADYDIGQPVTTVEFSPDGLWLFAGGQSGNAILVDTVAGDASAPLEGEFRGGVVAMDWHPQGTEFAVVSLGGINRYVLPTAALIAEHRVAGGARGLAYGPDGSWFVTGSGDFQFSFGEIAFWDTSAGTKLVSLNLGGPVESVSVHGTGTVVASFRSTDDLIETGGAWLVPGPRDWITLACESTEGIIGEQTWTQLTGEATSHDTGCP
ncbi:MAG: hypothetical protein ACR2QO_10505 [Acidimicrobiales bacterium]